MQASEFKIGDLVIDKIPFCRLAFGIIIQKTIFGKKVMHRVVWFDPDDSHPYPLWEEDKNITLMSRSR
jgi:hypothetical protein